MSTKKEKMCQPPCDTCGGTMTEEECREMASHHDFPMLVILLLPLLILFAFLFD